MSPKILMAICIEKYPVRSPVGLPPGLTEVCRSSYQTVRMAAGKVFWSS